MRVFTRKEKYQAYRRLPVGSRCGRARHDEIGNDLGFEGPAAAGHGALDGDGDERRGIFFEGIAAENDEIGELPCFDGALEVLFVRSVGAIDGAYANGFFHGNFLLWAPN